MCASIFQRLLRVCLY